MGENICMYTFDKGLISKICIKLNKIITQSENEPKEDIQMTNSHMEMFIREGQIKLQ